MLEEPNPAGTKPMRQIYERKHATMVAKQDCAKAKKALDTMREFMVNSPTFSDELHAQIKTVTEFIEKAEKGAPDESVHEAAKRGFGTIYGQEKNE